MLESHQGQATDSSGLRMDHFAVASILEENERTNDERTNGARDQLDNEHSQSPEQVRINSTSQVQ
jgi:hypothetical protein